VKTRDHQAVLEKHQPVRAHNLYADENEIRAEGARRGMKTQLEITGLAFDRRRIDGTPAITEISYYVLDGQLSVKWTYTRERPHLRFTRCEVHGRGTGKQLSARNVVVMWAQHKWRQYSPGTVRYEIVLAGSGAQSSFHDGQRYDCTCEATKKAHTGVQGRRCTQVKLARATPGCRS